MDAERWRQLERVFSEALELPEAERAAFVAGACGDDVELRHEVLELLAADNQLGQQFLERPALRLADSQVEHLAERFKRVASGAARREEAPERVGRYRIDGLLGEGAMGRVYRAHDEQLDRTVALKLLHSDEPQRVQRFQQEARAQGRLEHEHICRVYDVGEADGRPYIAMQLINGVTLSGLDGQLSTTAKVEVVRQAAEALQAAHDLGVIHRDIKPTNIMVETGAGKGDDDEVKAYVLDFGIARLVEAPGLTVTGQVFGTPAFMAPEQVDSRAGEVDQRADVYALGATLYALLAGRAPFAGASQMEILLQLLSHEPQPLRRSNPEIPAELEAIVSRCLDKQPERRYASARALANELRRFLAGEPIEARSTGPLTRMLRKAGRHRALTGAIGTAVILALVLAGVLLHQAGSQRVLTTDTRAVPSRQYVDFEEVAAFDGEYPAITPDGKGFVYVSANRGEIWTRLFGSDTPTQVHASERGIAHTVVSPDGQWVYFDQIENDQDRSVLRVPLAGGDPIRVTSGWAPAISPRGDSVACLDRDGSETTSLVVCSDDGSNRRTLKELRGPFFFNWSICFSPDGNSIVLAQATGFQNHLLTIDFDTGATTASVSILGSLSEGLAVLPSGGAVWCVRDQSASATVLGVTDTQAGGFRSITTGEGDNSNPTLSAKGSALLVCFWEFSYDLAEVPVSFESNASNFSSEIAVIPMLSGFTQPRVSPSQTKLAVTEGSTRQDYIAVFDRGRNSFEYPIPLDMVSFNPEWSPDGRELMFAADTDGQSDLWIVNARGGVPRRVTDNPANDYHQCWFPDGERIIWVSDRDGISSLYTRKLQGGTGGAITKLTAGEHTVYPTLSPDGSLIAFVSHSEAGPTLKLHKLNHDGTLGDLVWKLDGKPHAWAGYRPRFSPDGVWLGFEAPREPMGGDLFAVPVANAGAVEPVRLTALPFPVATAWWDWMGNDRIVMELTVRRRRLLLLRDADRAIREVLGS